MRVRMKRQSALVAPLHRGAIEARPVGRQLTARGLEITDPLTLGGARHLSVIVPMRHFILVHAQLRAGKADLARVADQPVRMIRVHMRQQDGVDLCRIDSGQGQILRQPSECRSHAAAGTCLDQSQPPAGMDGKGIDGDARRRRPEMTRQNGLGILWRNPHHRIRRIDVTVTQCGHDDVADAPMIDAGDLLVGNRYAAASCGLRWIGPFWHQLNLARS